MSETKIKEGSVVRLNSDNDKMPKMTVTLIPSKTKTASVIWRTKDGKMHRELVPLANLRLVEDSDDEGIPPG